MGDVRRHHGQIERERRPHDARRDADAEERACGSLAAPAATGSASVSRPVPRGLRQEQGERASHDRAAEHDLEAQLQRSRVPIRPGSRRSTGRCRCRAPEPGPPAEPAAAGRCRGSISTRAAVAGPLTSPTATPCRAAGDVEARRRRPRARTPPARRRSSRSPATITGRRPTRSDSRPAEQHGEHEGERVRREDHASAPGC